MYILIPKAIIMLKNMPKNNSILLYWSNMKFISLCWKIYASFNYDPVDIKPTSAIINNNYNKANVNLTIVCVSFL